MTFGSGVVCFFNVGFWSGGYPSASRPDPDLILNQSEQEQLVPSWVA